ncbi:glycosyltransferase family 4 protein [Parafrigoribacterium soli]|uniref:glycosyltransferase family 4 protein n=1 Tax=Parafrigoribacterium soli TaxID=3144663 RepID=UPI0032EAB342
MRVVFDAFWWGGGPPSLRHVLREIVFAWHDRFPEDDLMLVTRKQHDVSDVPAGIGVCESTLWPQALLATRAVAHAARRWNADVVVTHNFAAKVPNATSAVYLHDVLFTTNPEWFTPLERTYFSLMPRLASHADVVFTSSNSESARIRSHSHAKQVIPVGLGLSSELIDPTIEEDPDPRLVPGEYLLAVGRLNVRKNLDRTILSALGTGRVDAKLPLVVAGSADGKADTLDVRVQNAIESGAVVFTGFVSEARLRWLYRNTKLFLFLSLGEGFGMPPVEAAYFGARVLVSDLAVFHESLGRMARYVDPTDPRAVTAAISDALRGTGYPRVPAGAVEQLSARHDWRTIVCDMRGALTPLAVAA